MAKIERFEDIEAWKKAREMTNIIFQITSEGAFAHNFGLRDQIQRASVSVMSNIAEGFERGGNSEFRHFLALAKGSDGEVRAQLYVALDAHLITQSQFEQLYSLANEISRLLSVLMRYLQASAYKGHKFKLQDNLEP